MDVFIYYKTLTVRNDIVPNYFPKKLSIYLVRAVVSVCSCHNSIQNYTHTIFNINFNSVVKCSKIHRPERDSTETLSISRRGDG